MLLLRQQFEVGDDTFGKRFQVVAAFENAHQPVFGMGSGHVEYALGHPLEGATLCA